MQCWHAPLGLKRLLGILASPMKGAMSVSSEFFRVTFVTSDSQEYESDHSPAVEGWSDDGFEMGEFVCNCSECQQKKAVSISLDDEEHGDGGALSDSSKYS